MYATDIRPFSTFQCALRDPFNQVPAAMEPTCRAMEDQIQDLIIRLQDALCEVEVLRQKLEEHKHCNVSMEKLPRGVEHDPAEYLARKPSLSAEGMKVSQLAAVQNLTFRETNGKPTVAARS
jgi:hypothetical protein